MPRKTLDIQQPTGEVERHIDRANGAPAVEAAMRCDNGTEEIVHVGYPFLIFLLVKPHANSDGRSWKKV